VTWKFSTKETRDAFAQVPEKLGRRHDAYCAGAVAQDYTAGIDPEEWRVVNAKLYLNN